MNRKHPFFHIPVTNGDEEARSAPAQEEQATRHRQQQAHHAYAQAEDGDRLPPFRPETQGSVGGLFISPQATSSQDAPEHQEEADGAAAQPAPLSDEELKAECQVRVCPECAVRQEADAERLRALADLDNARKRLAREKEESVRFAAEGVLTDILPSLDNLDLALQHAGDDAACSNFVTGVAMTRKLLVDALEKYGLHQVGAVGETFNPALHEAVGMADDPEREDGQICSLLSAGYVLHDRLLRPARVMVCKKS